MRIQSILYIRGRETVASRQNLSLSPFSRRFFAINETLTSKISCTAFEISGPIPSPGKRVARNLPGTEAAGEALVAAVRIRAYNNQVEKINPKKLGTPGNLK